MIGKILVGLLAVVCLSCSSTGALWSRRAVSGATCDPNVLRNCSSYTAKAQFKNITGLGNSVYETSGANLSCLTLDIKSLTTAAPIYNATYCYDNSGTVASSSFILADDDNGPARVLTKNSKGAFVDTSKMIIVGYVSNAQGFQGCALLSCLLTDQRQKEVVIIVKGNPPQCDVVNELKQQMKDQDSCLADVPLNTVYHGNDCINKP